MRTTFFSILLTLSVIGQTSAAKHHRRVTKSKACKARSTGVSAVDAAQASAASDAGAVAVGVTDGSISLHHRSTTTRTHTTTIWPNSISSTTSIFQVVASQTSVEVALPSSIASTSSTSSSTPKTQPAKAVNAKPTTQPQAITTSSPPIIPTSSTQSSPPLRPSSSTPASQAAPPPSSSSPSPPTSSPTSPSLLPNTYPSPKFLQPRSLILSHSTKSFQNLLSLTKDFTAYSGWTIVVGWHAIALQDKLMGTKTYEKVLGGMNPAWGGCGWDVRGVDCYNDDAGWAGLADVQGWESYGGDYLDKGVAVWQFITDHGLLTQGVLDSGAIPGVKDASVKISKECNGKTMLGGVFWQNGSPENLSAMKNKGLASVSTANYALLSAELCRVTKNTTYCDYAVMSQGFLDTHLYREDGLINDGINSDDCEVTGGPRSYTTGLYLQTAAILGHLLSSPTYTTLSQKSILSSISQRDFTAPTGIINEPDGDPLGTGDLLTFKAVFIRSLVNAHQYVDEGTQEAIRGFVNLQYWSMAVNDSDDARAPGWFGRNWKGPYEGYTSQSQLDALDVLNGLMLNPESAFPASGGEDGPVMGL